MLISRKILSNYINIDDLSTTELAKAITKAGFEVEGMHKLGFGENLCIGEIIECVDHPDSDHLHVCQVNVGDEVLQIVCGAPNARVGLKVIVALVGAKLIGGEIKAGVLRGVESNGMLCSLQELGVDPKSLTDYQKSGIEELASDAVVGNKDVLEYLGLDDEVLDIGLTPNRNDCMSSFAFAKEVGAILNREVNLPDYDHQSEEGSTTSLEVASLCDNCSYYSAKVVRNVEVKASSKWMKDYLQAVGIKSINNLVDISNIVMLETGQPLHFYDLDKLDGLNISVKDGNSLKYTALDDETYEISADDMMIYNGDKPIAIAGIIGGADTKVDENTKNILIEVASFNHVAIRNSARRFNLNTDASIRFTKGIEPKAVIKAMDRACDLLKQNMNNIVFEETKTSCELDVEEHEFSVSCQKINERLGTSFSNEAMFDVLKRLDLNPVMNQDSIALTIPTYRQDLQIEADISEEIIRILGYDDLVSTLPKLTPTAGRLNARQSLRRKLQTLMCNQGFYEAQTYSLVSDKLDSDAIMPLENNKVQLASPMSEDRKIMRSSIIPSLLNSVSYNLNRSLKDIALFEISNVYRENQMQERLSFVMCGSLHKTRWLKQDITADFYTAKGIVDLLLEELGFASNRVVYKENTKDVKHFHPYQSAEIYIGKDLLGIVGKIHPTMAKEYDVKDVVMCELNLELILSSKVSKIKFKPISKFPSITRDLAFVVSEDVKVQDLVNTINKNGKRLIQSVEVFDIYTGEHVEDGFKSIALSLTLQASDKTLTDDEINSVIDTLKSALEKQHQAELRG